MRQQIPSLPFRRTRSVRSAFTLVELLVVIGILLIVSAMTLSVVNLSISGDRIRGSARQVQSMLEGARSHAIYGGKNNGSKYQAGVRFVIDTQTWKPNQAYRAGDRVIPLSAGTGFSYRLTAPSGGGTSGNVEPTPWPTALGGTTNDNGLTWTAISDAVLVTSMQFVEIDPENSSLSGGVFYLARFDDNNDNLADSPEVRRLVGTPDSANVPEQSKTKWYRGYQQGLITNYSTVLMDGRKYQVVIPNDPNRFGTNWEELILTTPYTGPIPSAFPNVVAVPIQSQPEFQLLLPPQPMANQEPRVLSNGVVVDLSLSKGLSYFVSNSLPIDIMFSPRGSVVGPLSGTGIVQFVLSDRGDSLASAPLAWTTWQPSTSYPAGTYVVPLTGDAKSVFRTNALGTSGGTEPAWNNTLGGTTTDNGVTWSTLGVPKKERMIISLTPQTGKAAVHPIYVNPTGGAPDPYRYAETGEVAKQ